MARGSNAKILITASDKTKAAFKSVNDRMSRVKSAVFSMQSAIAGTAGAAGFSMLINNAIKSGDALAKTSDKLGLTTEALAGLRHAAEQTGVASNTMDMALQRMTRRIAEAAIGTGEAKDAIKQLGLNAQELNTMGPEKAFQKIAGAMSHVNNQGEKVRLGFKLFDSEGVALVNTLALGEDGLKAMSVEAEALGISLSRMDAARLEEVTNATDRMGKAFTGIGNNIAVEFSSLMVLAANKVMGVAIDSQKGINGLSDSMVNFAESAAVGAAGVADAMSAPINNVLGAAQSAWDGFNKMPRWMQEVGVFGAILGGKKGALAVAAVAAVANKLVTTKAEATAKAYQRLGNAMANNRKDLASVKSDMIPDWMQESRIEALQKRYTVLGAEMTSIQALMTHGSSASSAGGSTLFDGGAEGDTGRKKVIDWFADLRAQKKKLETATTTTTNPTVTDLSLPTGITGGGKTAAEIEAEKTQKIIDIHQAKFARLADMAAVAAMDDESRAIDALDKKINALDAEKSFLEEKDGWNLEREQAYNDARNAIVETAEAKLASIRKQHHTKAEKFNAQSWDNQVSDVAGSLIRMTAGVSSSNRKMFEINKAASIASAIVNTYQGVSGVLANYPGPIGWAMAAVQVAAGIAQVTKIASTSFGSTSATGGSVGGSVPSLSTIPGAPVTQTPSQQPAQQPQTINLFVSGVVSLDQLTSEIVPNALKDQINNRDFVLINGNSNQNEVLQLAAANA